MNSIKFTPIPKHRTLSEMENIAVEVSVTQRTERFEDRGFEDAFEFEDVDQDLDEDDDEEDGDLDDFDDESCDDDEEMSF